MRSSPLLFAPSSRLDIKKNIELICSRTTTPKLHTYWKMHGIHIGDGDFFLVLVGKLLQGSRRSRNYGRQRQELSKVHDSVKSRK